MRKLYGILGAIVASNIISLLFNLVVYGARTDFVAVVVVSSVLGLIAGAIIAVFDRGPTTNRARAIGIGATIYFVILAVFALLMAGIPGTTFATVDFVKIASAFISMIIMGAAAGFGYARASIATGESTRG